MPKTEQGDLFTALQKYEDATSPRTCAKYGERWFNQHQGDLPVLLSAPHACHHIRDDVAKMAEEYTAAIAIYVAKVTGCYAIYTTNKTIEDPNWVAAGEYKKAIGEMVTRHNIGFVIDIHGMTNRHHMGVALGTMLGRSSQELDVVTPFVDAGFELTDANLLPAELVSQNAAPIDSTQGAGQSENWRRLVVDHPRFTGGLKSQTVTRYACERLGIKSVQVELASVARIYHRAITHDWPYEYFGKPCAIAAAVAGLCSLAKAVS